MKYIEELLTMINNLRILTIIIILLVLLIIFILKSFAKNVAKQFQKVIDGEKEKWSNVNNRLDEIRITLEEMDEKRR